MNFFYTFNMKTIKQVLLIAMIAFFVAWGLFATKFIYKPASTVEDGTSAIYKGKQNIALTFNIGWGDEKAQPIIDELIDNEIKAATFFLAGSWAERNPDLVKKIVDQGFEIGLLGYEYKDYTKLDEKEIRRDINLGLNSFQKLNIKDVKYLRAPTGNFDDKTLKVATQYGLTVIHWSIDSKDWTNPGVEKIIKKVKQARQGDIVLLHASDSAKQTLAAIPHLIDHFEKKSLKLVTITELIANAETNSQLID